MTKQTACEWAMGWIVCLGSGLWRPSMPGKSKLTADAAEQATLRALSKSEQRGEADRARAILLTLEGRKAEDIAAVLGVHISTVRNWRGYFSHGGVGGVRGGPRPGPQGQNRPPGRGNAAGGLA